MDAGGKRIGWEAANIQFVQSLCRNCFSSSAVGRQSGRQQPGKHPKWHRHRHQRCSPAFARRQQRGRSAPFPVGGSAPKCRGQWRPDGHEPDQATASSGRHPVRHERLQRWPSALPFPVALPAGHGHVGFRQWRQHCWRTTTLPKGKGRRFPVRSFSNAFVLRLHSLAIIPFTRQSPPPQRPPRANHASPRSAPHGFNRHGNG